MSEFQLLASGPPAPSADFASLPHVLLVVDSFPKTLGGGERVALKLAGLLPRAGFRASLLTLSVHPETSFRPEDAPCPVYLLPLRSAYGPDALRGAFTLRRFLRQERVRVVQTFFESSDLWAGLVTRIFSGAKLFWSRRDMGILRQRKHSIAYRVLRRLPHGVFAVSARVASHITAEDGVPPERVHVVYNGLDLADIAPGRVRPVGHTPVVTTIGNVRPVKGHDVFLEAAAIVLRTLPETQFKVAGDILDTDYYEQLRAQSAKLGLGKRFEFLGKITDLATHLASADLFVLPSRSEGFSNALIEAMSNGVPVIATDVGGNAEAVDDGVNGLVVPPDDAEALARAMLSLLQDQRRAVHLARAAQAKVARVFTSEAMLRGVVSAFRKGLEE